MLRPPEKTLMSFNNVGNKKKMNVECTSIRGDPINVRHSIFQKTLTFLKIFLLPNLEWQQNTFLISYFKAE